MMKPILALLATACLLTLNADCLDLTQPADWQVEPAAIRAQTKLRKTGPHSMSVTLDGTTCYLSRTCPLVPGKIMRLEGKITSDNLYYLRASFLDKAGKPIATTAFCVAPNTHTALFEPVKASDTILKVKDASHWKQQNAIAVGKGDELPNQFLHGGGGRCQAIAQKDGYWEVTLKQPWGMDCPADTPLRQMIHKPGILIRNRHRRSTPNTPFYYAFQDESSTTCQPFKLWPATAAIRLELTVHDKAPTKKLEINYLKFRLIDSW